MPIPVLLLLAACHNEGAILLRVPDIDLRVDTPVYGEFLGDAPIAVTGSVDPHYAWVFVEGERVEVALDGTFEATLPVGGDYRVVDVVAEAAGARERVRVPVFSGHDPMDTWPGGATLRLTPAGMEALGESLGPLIDEIGWDQMILDALPTIDVGVLALTPVSVTHAPSAIRLAPAEDGIEVGIELREVVIRIQGSIPLLDPPFEFPIDVGYERILLSTKAIPHVDEAGMLSLQLDGATVAMDEPVLSVSGIESWLFDLVLEGVALLVEPLGEALVSGLVDQLGSFDLGGPYAFETDLLGTSIELRLSDVFGDLAGLGAGLGVGIGEPALLGPLPIPVPVDDRADVHASLGLHEGLLHTMLTGGIATLFEQDIQLPGVLGNAIGLGIEGLPGGDDVPEGDGWCLSVTPGEARVVRLKPGLDPLAVLYMPDVTVDIGILDGSDCERWLLASVAFEVGLDVRGGTKLEMDVEIPDGAILAYETGDDWEEDEVVDGLTGFLGGVLGLLGGQLSFDLADLAGVGGGGDDPLGGALGALEPEIVDSRPLLDAEGNHPEGLYAVGLRLWDDAP